MRSLLAVMGVAAALLAVPLAAAGVQQDVGLNVTGPEGVDALVVQEWTEGHAIAFRQSLDETYGDGDGNLTAAEVDTVEAEMAASMLNQSLPLVAVGVTPATVRSVDAAVEGAEGSVNATGSVIVRHHLGLDLGDALEGDEVTLALSPHHHGVLSAQFPVEWSVTGTENVQDARIGPGVVTGRYAGDATVVVVIRTTPEPPADPADATPPEPDAEDATPEPEEQTADAQEEPAPASGSGTGPLAFVRALADEWGAGAVGFALAGALGAVAIGGAWWIARRSRNGRE